MSKIKNFCRSLYKSDYDAVVSFVKDGHLDTYDFNVCSSDGFKNVLGYLCFNNIPHCYYIVKSVGLSLITVTFGDNYSHTYSFWSTYKEEDE
jgi:hypothetical protein